MPRLEYLIDASGPESNRLGVTLEFAPGQLPGVPGGGAEAGVGGDCMLFLPTWTPGSYLIREFSRQLGRVTAEDASTGREVPCRKQSKNRFLVSTGGVARVRIRYTVYARELSVRTADVTAEHAYWNHAGVLLWPLGIREAEVELVVRHPETWQLACALPARNSGAGTTTLQANGLDEVIDSPCLLGRFERFEWTTLGVQHAAVLDGLAGITPPPTLTSDLDRIVEQAAAVFGGRLPYSGYLFLCLFAADGHGGLEHASSTTLLMARTALTSPPRYREFLSLAAHELFHAWNVKRMRPVEFWQYDYEHENYTELLWLIEGWTAYYDDLLCQRAGLMSHEEYLAIVAKNVNAMRNGPGRNQLSLSESSFDAWIRLYRPDENTRNSSQNYYGNGAIAAMCADLLIRRQTASKSSLDDVIRRLFETTFAAGRGYTRVDVTESLTSVAGGDVAAAFNSLVDGPLQPDLVGLFADFGIRVRTNDTEKPYLGVTFQGGSTTAASITLGSPASAAGINPGDELLAIANLRVDSGNWQEVFQAVARIGEPLEVLLSRRGVITRLIARPELAPGAIAFELDDAATTIARQLRDGWLVPAAAKNPQSGSGAKPVNDAR